MEVYRLSREKYKDSLSGKGAARRGARWNSPGTEIIYTASNRSLAMAEVAVHFSLATLPSDYFMLTIRIPKSIEILDIDVKVLPTNWNQFPHIKSTQEFGDAFVKENTHCLLRVPSVVTKGDYNILINPHHKLFSKIRVVGAERFPFDVRIFE